MTAPLERVRRRPGSVLLNTGFLALAMAISAAAFWPVYRSESLVVAVAVALIAGIAIAVLGAALRWPGWAVGAAVLAAYLLLGVPAAVPSLAVAGVLPTVPGILELLAAAGLSWKELLTISLPVGSYQSLLVPVFLLVLVLTTAGLSTALRARWGELGILAPVALFAAAILLGPTTPARLPLSLALLVTALAFLIWRRSVRRRSLLARVAPESRDRRRAVLRTTAGAAAILTLAASGGAAASALAPASAPRQVLRSAVEIPFDPRDYASPLSGFRRWFQDERASQTMLEVQGLRAGDRVRVATLDAYDGVVYTVGSDRVSSASAAFTRVPSAIDPVGVSGRDATLDVTVHGYRGVWVPDAGALRSIDFSGENAASLQDSFYFNRVSGTGAVLQGLTAGDSYRLDAVLPATPDEGELAALRPGTAPVPELPLVPAELDAALERYAAGEDTPGERLVAAISGLREDGYVSHGGEGEPFSRSGHSADRITELLTAQPMLGDAEQYAVTAAIMARRLGFPARVVVGFVAPDDDPSTLRGEDASAWIEVHGAGAGWVAVDPNPPVRDVPEQQPDDAATVSRPQSVVPPPPDDAVEQDEILPPDVSEEDQEQEPPLWLGILLTVLRVLAWTVLVAAILLAPFLAIVGAKWRRRRRRRTAGEPLDRVVGGWDEFADAAADFGVDTARTATRNELAIAVGGRRPLVLASAVDRATFAPGDPQETDVERVWAAVTELRAELGRGRTRWERLKALVSLRSLRRGEERRR
ncbi:transglutaminase-like domain-containing protein [Naasia sp. SYSU D00948]|uniref:transglutaminase-like domain-containing protein n=1 Tax=Naasia sp. SYSU D00948 TaxID=2817379 RepID=UPI0027DE7428|nr:transglutaminase-like domain-containing protein [Naasia sp. SYSU D00948]